MTAAVLERPQPQQVRVVRYEPRGAAKTLMSNRESVVLLCGAAGTGKTLSALMKLHLAALRAPGLRGLIVRQTHRSLTGSTLQTFEHQVVTAAMAEGVVRWFGGSERQPPAYRYSNGSTITVGGLDQPSKFLSAEFDRVLVDEATETTETALETLITRLRGTAETYRQIVLCCNPDAPQHWLYQRASRGALPMLHSRHADNPRYVNADGTYTQAGKDYFDKLNALTGVRRLRLLEGKWAAAEGVVYEEFDAATHVIPLPTFSANTRLCSAGLPWTWSRYWSVDFGYTNPTVVQRWAEDPDGNLWLYRESYRSQRLVEDHVKDLKRQVQDERGVWTEPHPRVVLADHDAEDRSTFHRHMGISTQAADKRVTAGIQAVKERFVVRPNGKPRLFILANALFERDPILVDAKKPTCTLDEIGSYIWNTAKDAPVKEDDHGMDAMRYMVAHKDLQGTTRVRFI
jgi:phage terminase large subunit